MKYHSTNNHNLTASLKEAVLKGLAEDGGLFMPEKIHALPEGFFESIGRLSFAEIAVAVAHHLFDEDLPPADVEAITRDAISFDVPLVHIHDNIYTLELFHGPTFAFKDVGARFMARLLGYFTHDVDQTVHVLVATSGDTGSAVANGFWKVPGIHVHILFPRGLVSPLQEKQFTTLGENITALSVDGTFDDCQRLVKTAFLDNTLNHKMILTSANSINLARLLPQSFYYFNGFARMNEPGKDLYISVPSGNFGNLTAGMMAGAMGLPVKQYITATNINDIVPKYLESGTYTPAPSKATIANAMDVGDPSNFVRIFDMFGHSHEQIAEAVHGYRYTDRQIKEIIKEVYHGHGYLLDPHSATGYRSLYEEIHGTDDAAGFFIATAHPAKFHETVEEVIGEKVEIPPTLQETMARDSEVVELTKEYSDFQGYLLDWD